jgi:hypothetical protein
MPDAKLELWLNSSARRRPLVRTLSALDGFLTAGVVGPRLPNPFIPMFASLGLTARAWHTPTPAESAVLGGETLTSSAVALIYFLAGALPWVVAGHAVPGRACHLAPECEPTRA